MHSARYERSVIPGYSGTIGATVANHLKTLAKVVGSEAAARQVKSVLTQVYAASFGDNFKVEQIDPEVMASVCDSAGISYQPDSQLFYVMSDQSKENDLLLLSRSADILTSSQLYCVCGVETVRIASTCSHGDSRVIFDASSRDVLHSSPDRLVGVLTHAAYARLLTAVDRMRMKSYPTPLTRQNRINAR
jgi:hypothetical protein